METHRNVIICAIFSSNIFHGRMCSLLLFYLFRCLQFQCHDIYNLNEDQSMLGITITAFGSYSLTIYYHTMMMILCVFLCSHFSFFSFAYSLVQPLFLTLKMIRTHIFFPISSCVVVHASVKAP